MRHLCRNLFLMKQSKVSKRAVNPLSALIFFSFFPMDLPNAEKMSVKDPQPKNGEASSGSMMKNSYADLQEAASRSRGDCPGGDRRRTRCCCSSSLSSTKWLDRLCPSSSVPTMRTARQLGPCSPQISAGTQKFYF